MDNKTYAELLAEDLSKFATSICRMLGYFKFRDWLTSKFNNLIK